MPRTIALAALLYGTGLAFADGRTLPYRRLVEPLHLEKVARVDPSIRSGLVYRVRLTPDDESVDAGALRIRTAIDGQQEIFSANRFGAFELPLTEQLYQRNPDLYINYDGSLSLGVELALQGDFSDGIDIGEITRARQQYRDTLAEIGRLASLFAPKIRRLVLRTGKPGILCSVLDRTLGETDQMGELRVPIKQLPTAGSTILACGAPVAEVLLETG